MWATLVPCASQDHPALTAPQSVTDREPQHGDHPENRNATLPSEAGADVAAVGDRGLPLVEVAELIASMRVSYSNPRYG